MIKTWKILYCHLKNVISNSTVWGLVELDLDVELCPFQVPDAEYDESDVLGLMNLIKDKNLVISMDFSAAIAEACNRAQILYISWIYDSPQRSLYMKESQYDTNLIFVFDKKQRSRLEALSIPHLYHQPLAANVTMVSALEITDEDIAKFSSDISFIGNLYKNSDISSLFADLSESVSLELNSRIQSKIGNWGRSTANDIFNPLSDDTLSELMNKISGDLGSYQWTPEFFIQIMLAREASSLERFLVINRISDVHKIDLYTKTQNIGNDLPNAVIHGPVDYDTDMFKVFYSSKINLNITMASIETGVPQRVFDIMSIGGFAMSNEQEELYDLFVPRKEIVIFSSIDEMIDKIDYYLNHEDERIKTGINGYKRVSKDYTTAKALRRMLRIAEKTMD